MRAFVVLRRRDANRQPGAMLWLKFFSGSSLFLWFVPLTLRPLEPTLPPTKQVCSPWSFSFSFLQVRVSGILYMSGGTKRRSDSERKEQNPVDPPSSSEIPLVPDDSP